MSEKYRTIFELSEAVIIEKKSRFIATISPANTIDEAQCFINEMRKKYWDASHNVFAYQIGLKNEHQRLSDDGEPSGTAGIPIMEVIRGEGLKNVIINVTRYFGGTLLGTGGLVRAYGKSAKEAVNSAKIIEKILLTTIFVTITYHYSGKIQYASLQSNYIIKDTVYTDNVKFIILVPSAEIKKFTEQITDITNGTASVSIESESYETVFI